MSTMELFTQLNSRVSYLQRRVAAFNTETTVSLEFVINYLQKQALREEIAFLQDIINQIEREGLEG